MNEPRPIEITCPACGQDSLLLRKPRYEGFTKAGEDLSCASCGHPFASEEEVPFRGKAVPRVFTDADKSRKIEVFTEDDKGRMCLYCASYIVNPFTQWCSRHKKEVQATDTCENFAVKPPPKKIL